VRVHCCGTAIAAGWKVLLWDEFEDVVFDAFRVGLFGLVRNRLDLEVTLAMSSGRENFGRIASIPGV